MNTHPADTPKSKAVDFDLAVDGALRELARDQAQEVDAEFVGGVMAAVRRIMQSRATIAEARAAWGWLLTPRVTRLAALFAVGLFLVLAGYSAVVFSAHANPVEIFLYSEREFNPGLPIRVRVLLRNGRNLEPVANSSVRLKLTRLGAGEQDLGVVSTNADGFAVLTATPRDFPEGTYTLSAVADTGRGPVKATLDVVLRRAITCMLSTDKPVYQPGQVMHLRTLSLETVKLKPAAGAEVTIEVADGNGNRVFKQRLKTSKFGIAAADFVLADQVNTGDYVVKATIGESTTEKTVEVKHYVLPRFAIEVKTGRGFYAPGETVTGELRATFMFGQPVADAEVTLDAWDQTGECFTATHTPPPAPKPPQRPRGPGEFFGIPWPSPAPPPEPHQFTRVQGKTDAQGRFAIALPLKQYYVGGGLGGRDAIVKLVATVRDRTGHGQQQVRELVVSETGIRIEAIPECGKFLPSVESRLYLFTSYPDGTPAQATVNVAGFGTVPTAANGVGIMTITPPDVPTSLLLTATDANGVTGKSTTSLNVDSGGDSFVIHTDQSVYRTGDTIVLDVFANRRSGVVFVDMVRGGCCLLMKSVPVVNGRGRLLLDVDPEIQGTVQLHSYSVTASGDVVRDTRLIQVVPATGLEITAALDRDVYRPGETAKIDFTVRDSAGQPQPAALSVAVLDEAVFALTNLAPGFERAYFLLQEELLQPKYQIPAAATLVPSRSADLPGCQPAAGVLLSQPHAPAVPQMVVERWTDREYQLKKEKMAFGKKLGLTLAAIFAVMLFCLLLPLLALAGRRSVAAPKYELPADECEHWNEAVMTLVKDLVWLGFATFVPLLIFMFAKYSLWLVNQNVGGAALVLAPGLALPVIMAYRGWRRQPWRRVITLCPRGDKLPQVLFFLPAFYSAWFLAVLTLAVAACVFPGLPGLLGLDFLVLTLVALVIGATLTCSTTVQTRDSLSGDDANIGLHIGSGMPGWMAKVIVCACWLPLVGVALYVLFTPLALFMPLIKLTDMMGSGGGGGGGYGGGSWPSESVTVTRYVQPAKIRRYFPETLLWRPEIVTDANGKATLECRLADAITTWRLSASAVSASGQLGVTQQGIRVFQDFFVDLDVPAQLTQNDRISLPVLIYNYLKNPQTIRLTLDDSPAFKALEGTSRELTLAAGEIRSVNFAVQALAAGEHLLRITALGTTLSDAVERRLEVIPDGARGGKVENDYLAPQSQTTVEIPANAIPGGTDMYLKIYPGPVAQVAEGLDGLIQMPHGCFEQASSITYPNIMVLRYLRQTGQIAPALELKALSCINAGYQRLLSFEVKGGGFSLYGKSPASVVLSAYGLMEFKDMAAVRDVDPEVLARTRAWLLKQATQGQSIYWSAPNNYRSMGGLTSDLTLTAYVAWVLAECGETGDSLDRALNYITDQAATTTDSYTLALCVNALQAARRPAWQPILARVLATRHEDDKRVWWESGAQGVTYSWGLDLHIETTALLTTALLRSGEQPLVAQKALYWLVQQKDRYGTWYSTQATVQALRALLASAGRLPSGLTAPIEVTVAVNGRSAERLMLTPENADVLHLIGLKERLQPGANRVQIGYAAKVAPPNIAFQLCTVYYTSRSEPVVAPAIAAPATPAAAKPAKALEILLDYDRKRLEVDDLLTAKVFIRNPTASPLPMVMVDLGIPPGFEVVTADLDKLVTSQTVERYECAGRQLILYLNGLEAGGSRVFSYGLRAKYPVKVKTPESRVYLYYEPAVQATAPPMLLEVEPRTSPGEAK